MNPKNTSTISFTLLKGRIRSTELLDLFPQTSETEGRTSSPTTSMGVTTTINHHAPDRDIPGNRTPPAGQRSTSRRPDEGGHDVNGARGRQNSSNFKGVSLYKRTGRWETNIWIDGEQYFLGASATEIQAARAYDRAVIHFKRLTLNTEVFNFRRQDYAAEEQQLIGMSSGDLIAMLRAQSRGDGIWILAPGYPPPKSQP